MNECLSHHVVHVQLLIMSFRV